MPILNTARTKSYITVLDEKVEINTNSNTNRTNYLNTDLIISKTSSKSWGMPENTLTISTQITNNTDINLSNLTFTDELIGATFVEGSLKINSELKNTLDPTAGFEMPITLGGSGADVVVEYDVIIDKYPETDEVSCTTSLIVEIGSDNFNLTSSPLTIDIITNDLSILKTANKTAVISGGTIEYTFEISNNGAITHTDLFFTDTIPQNTEFITDSVTINGTTKAGYNPQTGFTLPDISQDETVTVTFQVSVN